MRNGEYGMRNWVARDARGYKPLIIKKQGISGGAKLLGWVRKLTFKIKKLDRYALFILS